MDLIVVDREFLHLLDGFDPSVRRLVDDDAAAPGEFDEAIARGLALDCGPGWDGLHAEAQHEDHLMALAYTSGTTAKPKVPPFPNPPRPIVYLCTDGEEREG